MDSCHNRASYGNNRKMGKNPIKDCEDKGAAPMPSRFCRCIQDYLHEIGSDTDVKKSHRLYRCSL